VGEVCRHVPLTHPLSARSASATTVAGAGNGRVLRDKCPLSAKSSRLPRSLLGAAAAGFALAAVVTDEERRHEGPEAIRRWMEETSALYHDQSAVKSVSTEGNTTQVTAEVSGTFPGSPILLRYTFTLDGEQISRLDITG
jgi:hypothetical protein